MITLTQAAGYFAAALSIAAPMGFQTAAPTQTAPKACRLP